jgi:two-component system phosphate regulon response regulator PhoB
MIPNRSSKSDMPADILVVEDEVAIREMLQLALERLGHTVHAAGSTLEARKLLAEKQMHMAIVDWMLPGGSGLELVRSLRKQELYRHLPIIMLTARTEEHDITAGLDAGADDYVTKPFSPRELNSRINALLRRSHDFHSDAIVTVGPLVLDAAAHQVTVGGQEIPLGHTEFKLISFLMNNPDHVYSRSQLLDHVWGTGTYIEERTVDVHILRLRKNLKPFAAESLLETVRGAGYKLTAHYRAH